MTENLWISWRGQETKRGKQSEACLPVHPCVSGTPALWDGLGTTQVMPGLLQQLPNQYPQEAPSERPLHASSVTSLTFCCLLC